MRFDLVVLVTTLVCALAFVCLASVGYLLLLLVAATLLHGRRRNKAAAMVVSERSPRFTVLVPAHNEELVLGATLASLRDLAYPKERFDIVVMADNCTDSTADIARAAGVTVIERFNTVERGKGFALAEAMRQLLARDNPADAFVIVDADTEVAGNFLAVIADDFAKRIDSQGRYAVQGRYGVLNHGEGWRAALMAGAFDLFNHVKPLGREALGFSVGLKGNGMVFSRELLRCVPFTGSSITEDIDYGLDLLLHHGVRVGYVPDALVRAQMPVTAGQAKSQRQRWENGRFKLMRERVPSLLAAALRRGDVRLADAAVDMMLPPLAELSLLLTVWTALTVFGLRRQYLAGPAVIYIVAITLGISGFVAYVLGGFKVAGAPSAAYSALLKAPGYAIWKIALYATKPFGRRASSKTPASDEWVRTERIAINTKESQVP